MKKSSVWYKVVFFSELAAFLLIFCTAMYIAFLELSGINSGFILFFIPIFAFLPVIPNLLKFILSTINLAKENRGLLIAQLVLTWISLIWNLALFEMKHITVPITIFIALLIEISISLCTA